MNTEFSIDHFRCDIIANEKDLIPSWITGPHSLVVSKVKQSQYSQKVYGPMNGLNQDLHIESNLGVILEETGLINVKDSASYKCTK